MYFYDYNLFVTRFFWIQKLFWNNLGIASEFNRKGYGKKLLDYSVQKASEQYLNLQKNLTKIESQLQAARRIYNSDVTAYNIKLETVPSNIVANLFGFKPAQLFEIEEYKKENVNIKLED